MISFFLYFWIMENKLNPNEIPAIVRAVLELHIGKNFAEFTTESQIELLEKRGKRYRIMILVNLLALLFFSYSFIYKITQIADVIYYVLGVVFVLNMLLIFYQRKQLMSALEYIRRNK